MVKHLDTHMVKLLGMQMPITDAAEALKVSTNTVRRWLTNGLLTGEKIGNKWLINVGLDAPAGKQERPGARKEWPDGQGTNTPPEGLDERLVVALQARIDAQEQTIDRLTQLLAAHSLNAAPGRRWWQVWK